MSPMDSGAAPSGNLVSANGLKIYDEGHGSGRPLLLLHRGLTKDAELAIIPNATHFSMLTELGIGTVVDFLLRQSKATVTS